MNISCDVVMDLLPLYCDNVCSKSSKELVEEHLRNCDVCKNILKKMKDYTIDNQLKQERNNVVGHHLKALKRISLFRGATIAIAIFTLLLLISEIRDGNNWLTVMVIPFLYGLIIIPFAIKRYIKVNASIRAGLSFILIPTLFYIFEMLFNWITEGDLRLRFIKANLFVWDNLVVVNANIDLLVLITCGIVGGILLVIGLSQKRSN